MVQKDKYVVSEVDVNKIDSLLLKNKTNSVEDKIRNAYIVYKNLVPDNHLLYDIFVAPLSSKYKLRYPVMYNYGKAISEDIVQTIPKSNLIFKHKDNTDIDVQIFRFKTKFNLKNGKGKKTKKLSAGTAKKQMITILVNTLLKSLEYTGILNRYPVLNISTFNKHKTSGEWQIYKEWAIYKATLGSEGIQAVKELVNGLLFFSLSERTQKEFDVLNIRKPQGFGIYVIERWRHLLNYIKNDILVNYGMDTNDVVKLIKKYVNFFRNDIGVRLYFFN